MTPRELAIARSVIYASLFDYPLTLDQLHAGLLESEQTPEEILAVFDGSEALQHIVEYRDGFFFPAGRDDLLAERGRREARSLAFLERQRRLLQLVCAIPFTRAVALSGSIAHLNLEADGDLDLFIVTRGPRVWTVTLAAIVLARILGRRRDLCINFILADSHLRLEPRDLFTANQVIHLKPLIGADVLARLRGDNRFIASIYPNAPVVDGVDGVPGAFAWTFPQWCGHAKQMLELILGLPAPLLEAACRHAYGWHLRRRAATWRSPDQVRLQSDYLKLHTRSHRHSVIERFEAAVDLALRQAERLTLRRAVGGRR
jgi:hypothetical protein